MNQGIKIGTENQIIKINFIPISKINNKTTQSYENDSACEETLKSTNILSKAHLPMNSDNDILKNKSSFNYINSETPRFNYKEENLTNEEIKTNDQNFIHLNDKNNNKVRIPLYKDNKEMEKFLDSNHIDIKEFSDDNDVNTDHEQLYLEIERNNNSLLNFMENVNKDDNYINNNLWRKINK